MATATASAPAVKTPRLRPIANPLKGGTNSPPVRIPTPSDDEFSDAVTSSPAVPAAAAPATFADAPAPAAVAAAPAPSVSIMERVHKTQVDLADLFRKGDVLGWGIVTIIGLGIIASGLTGLIPHWGVAVGLVAFLCTGGFVKDFVSALFVATVRRKAAVMLLILFGVGAALLGAIGTVGWAYAISGISFLTFAMLLHSIHGEKLAVRTSPSDNH